MVSASSQPPTGPAASSTAPSGTGASAAGDPLEVVKFVCKEFWEEVFRKKVGTRMTVWCIDDAI
jgi:hypothetical protein